MTTMTEITGCVERGAALLDQRRPGWWRGIDLPSLDIDSPCRCVAGQLGDYTVVLYELGLYEDEEFEYGFDGATHEETADLTEAWRNLIAGRRAGQLVSA